MVVVHEMYENGINPDFLQKIWNLRTPFSLLNTWRFHYDNKNTN